MAVETRNDETFQPLDRFKPSNRGLGEAISADKITKGFEMRRSIDRVAVDRTSDRPHDDNQPKRRRNALAEDFRQLPCSDKHNNRRFYDRLD